MVRMRIALNGSCEDKMDSPSGAWSVALAIDDAHMSVWQKALTQNPHLQSRGTPSSVQTKETSEAHLMFTFDDGSKVEVFEDSIKGTLTVSETQRMDATTCAEAIVEQVATPPPLHDSCAVGDGGIVSSS